MALWVCSGCTTAYAVGVPACPHCGHTDHGFDWEDDMAKITVAGGPSNADALPGEPGYITPEGGDGVSAGTSSSTSVSRPDSNGSRTPTSLGRPSPAPTTGSPSSQDPPPSPASGGASSTGGSTRGTGSGRSRRRASSMVSPKDPAPTADPPDAS